MASSDLTGKHKVRAQNVSHSNIKTKRWQRLNVQSRRIFVPELGRFVRLNVTTRDLRSIDKLGFWAFLTKTLDRRMTTMASPKDAAGLTGLFKKLGIEVVFEATDDHAGHDHAGHDHAGHDHAGHDHGDHAH